MSFCKYSLHLNKYNMKQCDIDSRIIQKYWKENFTFESSFFGKKSLSGALDFRAGRAHLEAGNKEADWRPTSVSESG